MYKVWSFFIHKKAFSFLVLVALAIFGVMSLVQIPKESAPEVKVPVGIITTVLPGASAQDVEELVTNEIEKAVYGSLESLNKLTSTSREGVSVVVAEFDADADLDDSIRELRDEVAKAEPLLPSDAEDPVVSEVNFVDQPVVTFAISGNLTDQEFTRLSQEVEDEIAALSGVSRVEVAGARAREAQVIVDREALTRFNINLADIVSAIRASNTSQPIGSIDIGGASYNIAFEGSIEDPSEIGNVAILSISGEPIYIRDVAEVIDGLETPQTISRISVEGAPSEAAISFNVFKDTGGDITDVTTRVGERIAELQEEGEILNGFTVLSVLDSGELLQEDLTRLSFTGLQTIVLVMCLLFVAIGWRESLIAGIAIPLSFLIAFIGLYYSGNTINFVSLFALILAVGILVDSAIVIVEGIHTNMKRQMDKTEAALKALKEFYLPLTAGTLTTVAVFFPLFLISGVTGEFIATIPFTIIFVLFASLFVALGLLPLFASLFLRRRMTSKMEEKQEIYTGRLQEYYRGIMRSIVSDRRKGRRVILGVVAAFIITLSFPFFGIVEVAFFPQGDADYLQVDLEMPQGTNLSVTDFEMRRVEEFLYQEKDIESFSVTTGQAGIFTDGTIATHLASVFINLREDREKTSLEVLEDLEEQFVTIKTAEVRASQPDDGPPTGAPILIQFFGDDLNELEDVAVLASNTLEGIEGVRDVQSSANEVQTEFVLAVDTSKATSLGLTTSAIANALRIAVEGSEATSIRKLDEDIDIRIKLALNPSYIDSDDTNDVTIDAVRQIPIQTQNGNVLLGSLLEADIRKSNTAIRHEDRERIISVTSEVESTANALVITREFEDMFDTSVLPLGVSMRIGGENEDVQQSFQDMFAALGLGIVLMLAVLILQFDSYRYAFYVLSVVPFSLIGIFLGLAISGRPISFPSMMGFVALSGIVVNNSIILIDVINKIRKENPEREIADVVLEGSTLRLRPIVLTTVTTIFGMIPLIFVSELWAPLAFAVMFGLISSVVVTLVLVPVIYVRWPGRFKEGWKEHK